ncbi:MAG: flagellar assembly peptidoglycan hydrolase FlgJ [Formivibrio sp.]|nr:flagellar assembly peptidoglycan hydrolase FlgJ [Formivibrio sp.]
MTPLLQSTMASQTLAIDPQSLRSLRNTASHDAEAGVRAVAKQFEALMMQQMLKSMRQANQGMGEENSSALNMFQSMQDQQFAQLNVTRGGLGLADAIVRQINVQRDPSLLSRSHDPKAEISPVAVKAATTATLAAKPAASAGGADDFLSKLAGVAEEVATKLGLSSKLLLAHAALESGWGSKSIKTADGNESFNLFGIKAGKNWTGKTVDVQTTEYIDGKAQKRVEKFRAYASYAEAFSDYSGLIKRRFGDAMGLGSDSAGFGKALQAGGYATDPNYANKIARVAESITTRLAAHQSRSSQTV